METISNFQKISTTVVRLLAGSKMFIGGRYKTITNALDCNLATTGFGGLDVGSIASGNYYYVYAVIFNSNVGLVASLSSTAPVGFLIYRKVGAFNTEQLTTNIEQVLSFGHQPDSAIAVHNGIGPASTNTRFGRFDTLTRIKGLEIEWQQSTTLGDKFQCGKAGIYEAVMGYADTLASGQECGLSINSDAFGTTNFSGMIITNPELRFTQTRSRTASNLGTSLGGSAYLEENSYLHVHSEQASSISSGIESYVHITKKGKDEIDWTI